jgi:hypothetical protein
MKNKYKNRLFHLIRELNFSPNDFVLSEDDDDGAFVVTYSQTPLKFFIREADDEFDIFDSNFTTYSPQYYESEPYPKDDFDIFDKVLSNFKDWIKYHVQKYISGQEDEDDLWSEYLIGNQSIEFKEISFDNQSSFTTKEKKQVVIAINELKFLIQTNIATSSEEQKIVSDRLDYLVENIDRLNKFEWKSMLLSTLISISITLSLDTESGRILFEYLKKVFSTFPKLLA